MAVGIVSAVSTPEMWFAGVEGASSLRFILEVTEGILYIYKQGAGEVRANGAPRLVGPGRWPVDQGLFSLLLRAGTRT